MEIFKARLVKGRHMTYAPFTITDSANWINNQSSQGTNGIAANIMNFYIAAPNKENIWTLLGPKVDKDK